MAKAASSVVRGKHPFALLFSQTAVMSSIRKSLRNTCITREPKPYF